MVALSVAWRSSASRVPLSASSRSARRSSSASGVSSFVRAAASSSASGRPSSRVAELHDGVRRGDVGPHSLRALAEQRHRLVAHERREVELGLALDPERLAACGEQSQRGNGGHELGQRTRGPGRRCSRLSHTTCVRRSPTRAAIAGRIRATRRRAGRPPRRARTPRPAAARAGRRRFLLPRRRRAGARARSRSASCRFPRGRRS